MIVLGVDALCWHAHIVTKTMTLREVVAQVADLRASYLQLGVGYFEYTGESRADLSAYAASRGVQIRASGEVFGSPFFDREPTRAIAQIDDWLDEAVELGSDTLMLATGVYRAGMDSQEEINAELEYVRAVLDGAATSAAARGIRLSVENSSEFITEELNDLLQSLSGRCELFLDVANPINLGENPVSVIDELGRYATSGHIKDVTRTSIWNFDQAHRYGYVVNFAYPGEGSGMTPQVLSALARATEGRTFHLGIEGLDSKVGVNDQFERLQRSLDFLRQNLDVQA